MVDPGYTAGIPPVTTGMPLVIKKSNNSAIVQVCGTRLLNFCRKKIQNIPSHHNNILGTPKTRVGEGKKRKRKRGKEGRKKEGGKDLFFYMGPIYF